MATPISLAEAEAFVEGAVASPLGQERVGLADALGRRLAADQRTDGPWPSTDRSAMDGFALCAGAAGLGAGTAMPIVGEAMAGHPFDGEVGPGQAVRIMTGAVVPAGADAVVPVENTTGYDRSPVELQRAVHAGDNIRPCGSEVAAHSVVLQRGCRLRAAEIGVLAVLGVEQVPVYRRPVVGIVATGDEVVPIGAAPLPHQVRDSNSYALAAQVAETGAVARRLGVAPDVEAPLREFLADALRGVDVLLTIGGVSKGTADLVHGCLAALQVERHFHGIALKPGKPTFFGTWESAGTPRFVFGLPGNPASCFTVFDLLVAPLLARLMGATGSNARHRGPLAGAPQRRNWRAQAVPARRGADGAPGSFEALPLGPSGDPFALAHADGYVLLPADREPVAGEPVAFAPYAGGPRDA